MGDAASRPAVSRDRHQLANGHWTWFVQLLSDRAILMLVALFVVAVAVILLLETGDKRRAVELSALFAVIGVGSIGLVVRNQRRTSRELQQRVAERTSELTYERHLLSALMDSIPDSIYFKDPEGRYVRINRSKAERSGHIDPSRATGKSHFDFFPRAHSERA